MSNFFRATLRALAAHPQAALETLPARTKSTTTLTGLNIHPSPLPHLLSTYHSTLSLLSSMPATALYRRSTEGFTNERIEIIKKFGAGGREEDIERVEGEIGLGCIEEIIVMAEDELKLAGQMMEWKV